MFGWLTGSLVKAVTAPVINAVEVWQTAKNDKERIAAEERMNKTIALRDIVVAEQHSKLTSWIRPAIAAPIAIYVWKLFVWDSVLELGSTPEPGNIMTWIISAVLGAFFLTRPFENRGKK